MRHCKITCSLLLFFCALGHSQVTALPSWAAAKETLGDSGWSVPHYTGSNPLGARCFVSNLRRSFRRWGITVESHPSSGVLKIQGASPAGACGLRTGLEHVMDMDEHRVAGRLMGLTLVGRRSDGRSQVRHLAPPDGARHVITDLSVPSPEGELWVRATVVDTWLYVLDLASQTVFRYSDQDADGVFESRDSSFQVSFTSGLGPGDNIMMYEVWGFRRFASTPGGLVRLSFGRVRPSVWATIIESPPGSFSLSLEKVDAQNPLALRIASLVYAGCRRIHVVGTPGMKFVLKRVDVTPPRDLTTIQTMPASGWMILEVRAPLQEKQRIQVFSTSSTPLVTDRRETTVLAGPKVQIIQHQMPMVERSSRVRFVGNGFAAGQKACCRVGATSYDCDMTFVSANEVWVRMPMLGDPGGKPPFQKVVFGRIHLTDGSGRPLSDSVPVVIQFTP